MTTPGQKLIIITTDLNSLSFFLLFQTLKMKSSHDLLNDPKLSKQPAVENTISSVKVSLIYVCNCLAILEEN